MNYVVTDNTEASVCSPNDACIKAELQDQICSDIIEHYPLGRALGHSVFVLFSFVSMTNGRDASSLIHWRHYGGEGIVHSSSSARLGVLSACSRRRALAEHAPSTPETIIPASLCRAGSCRSQILGRV